MAGIDPDRGCEFKPAKCRFFFFAEWKETREEELTLTRHEILVGANSGPNYVRKFGRPNRLRIGADSAPNDVRPMFAGFGRPIGSDFTQKVVRQMFVRIGHDSVVLRGANSVFRTYPESDPIRSSE